MDAIHVDRRKRSLPFGIDGDVALAEGRLVELPANQIFRLAARVEPRGKPLHLQGKGKLIHRIPANRHARLAEFRDGIMPRNAGHDSGCAYAATRCAAMIWSAARPDTSAMRSNCLVKLPAPAVAERNSTISSPISASGIMARTRSQPVEPSRVSKPRIWPRRPDRMALIFAVASVGQTISTT